MGSQFHENGVLTGVAGSFCLLCEKYITRTDLPGHITHVEHTEKLESSVYVEKYKDDHIRKVKAGYYCEPCNMLIQTSSKVGIHVGNTTHATNRTSQLVRELDEGLVAFDDILIEKQAWSGLNKESCLVCNVEFSVETDHAKESAHILNVIQSKLELKRDRFVYRKVDDEFLNCLICNSLITVDSKESHADDSEHVTNYVKCKENLANHQIKTKHTEKAKVAKPIETGPTPVENGDKNNNNEKAEENNGKLDTKDEPMEKDESVLSPEEALRSAMKFAKENNLKYKRNSTYCNVCNVKISSTLARLKEHVSEESHKQKATGTVDEFVEKVPFVQFFKNETTVRNIFEHDVVINEQFCVTFDSYHTLSKHGAKVRCQLCEVSMERNEFPKHILHWKHVQAMQIASLLIGFSTEFVREVRPGLYHCGFCNFIESSISGLKNHLKSFNHGEKKYSAKVRLIKYLPAIREHEEDRHNEILARMFLGGAFGRF
ncbi:uncharacterized protein LOC112045435 [Bicyclus anynana]|uniref:Uncharacterized protein LOC112045435 n=1 Tax=Bicyclus anynana TaxID=110368 RepID=A0ABM3M0Q6_BICAN|nr:uncharacterized protein LOC112045435 [Bicyclus anynana]XP_052744909.1 uncharacterized protein LOC112045435 [Bicyclus anynana]